MIQHIIQLNDENFDNEIIYSKLPALVDFWAPWCNPCKMINPNIEFLSIKFNNIIKIAKLNIDDNPKITKKFNIKTIPTLIFFKNQKIIQQTIGVSSKENIIQYINQYLLQ